MDSNCADLRPALLLAMEVGQMNFTGGYKADVTGICWLLLTIILLQCHYYVKT